MPTHPIHETLSPTKTMAKIAATRGSNKVKVVALLAFTVLTRNQKANNPKHRDKHHIASNK